MGELDGKIAIVTGAGRLRGIGRAAAVELARLGADVVITGTGRKPETYPQDEKAAGWRDIESTADQVRALGRRALPVVLDVSDRDAVQRMMDKTLQTFGRADILVNNAAYPRGKDRAPIQDLDPDVFQRVMDIKVTGAYLCTKAFVKALLAKGNAKGAKIVNISSTAGKAGYVNTLAYCAGNFALVGMTQALARELGPLGVNVNCVCPGAVDTARMDVVPQAEFEGYAQKAAIGRNGTDEEVGAFAAYLCTEATSWITGQSININGGTVMEH